MYKQNQGRPNIGGTGNSITSKLTGVDPEKKATDKKIPTKKNPNLSPEEKALLNTEAMSAKRWRSYTKSKNHTLANFDKFVKAQRKRDSTFIVNNRVTRKGTYVDESMAFKHPADVNYDSSSLAKLYPQTKSKYKVNKFKRGKSGNVEIDYNK